MKEIIARVAFRNLKFWFNNQYSIIIPAGLVDQINILKCTKFSRDTHSVVLLLCTKLHQFT